MFADIDECEQPEACHGGQCTNTEGSYHCKCDKGYIMVRKGHCQGKDWGAALPSPGPSHTLVAPNSPSSLSLTGPLPAEPTPKNSTVWKFLSLFNTLFWYAVCSQSKEHKKLCIHETPRASLYTPVPSP